MTISVISFTDNALFNYAATLVIAPTLIFLPGFFLLRFARRG